MPRQHLLRSALLGASLLALAALSACGGMTNAVGVLPNTLDDLEAKSAAARGETDAPQLCETPPCQGEAR